MKLELKNIIQKYGDKVIFDDFNLTIEPGITAILGESGCGKSTLFRYLTGLQEPTSGEILINGNKRTDKDVIPLVFQERSTLPYYNVLDNVALPLLLKGVPKKEANEKAAAMLDFVELEDHLHKYAKYPILSGGQLQRVAIARSLVTNPSILLLDEPFGSLDSTTRRKMQQFVKELHNKLPESLFVIITHDEREATYLANDIYVLGANPGHVKQKIELQPMDRKSTAFFEAVNYLESII
jgi:NitT/TauT family transport system ATP-binding protein